MVKTVMALTISLLLLMLTLSARATTTDKQTVKVREADSGKTVTLKTGDTLELMLKANPSTGYTWQQVSGDESVLKSVDKAESKSEGKGQQRVGPPTELTLRYEAVASGKTTIKLAYLRPWEKDKEPAKIFEVIVVVS